MNRHSALVLHAHVPWVRHPESDRCLEEDWLFESIAECYLPLLEMGHRLREESVPWRLTLNLSPTLIGMLNDSLMRQRASDYLERTLKLAASEGRATDDPNYRRVAEWYEERLVDIRDLFENRWERDLVGAFRSLAETDHLEITACAATHGLLPLLVKSPLAARAQIAAGIAEYRQAFDRDPAGFWLPECAYSPVVATMLREEGIRWTLVEEHGLTGARGAAACGPYHPVGSGNNFAVFGRDEMSSREVWNADEGYPGDPRYREFYRDVGLDAPPEAIEEYLDGSGIRRFTGLKFFRITGDSDEKELYDPSLARRAVEEHASDFVRSRADQLASLEEDHDVTQPIVVSAFDAELFGHWWLEGPAFLEQVIRLVADRPDFGLTTPGHYLEETGGDTLEDYEPIASSWGEGGYFETWLSEENAWVYPHLNTRAGQLQRGVSILEENLDLLPEDQAEHRMRAIAQMTRELLLAQSSDWAFLMRNGAARPYATQQTERRIDTFDELWGVFGSGPDAAGNLLAEIEERTPIFPGIAWDTFSESRTRAVVLEVPEEKTDDEDQGSPED